MSGMYKKCQEESGAGGGGGGVAGVFFSFAFVFCSHIFSVPIFR